MEEELGISWKSESNSMLSATLGRAVNTLLNSRPKKLESAITRIGDGSSRGLAGSLDESLWFLSRYVSDAAEKSEPLDEVLIPMFETSLKSKVSKDANQAMILLNWLINDELVFKVLSKNLADIIWRREDHRIALGWCMLVRDIVNYDSRMKHLTGLKGKYPALLKILCSSIRRLTDIVCNGSLLQDGFELPTRLSMAAADCILDLTEALAKKALVSATSNEGMREDTSSTCGKPANNLNGKKEDTDNMASEILSNNDCKLLLWEQLDQLIILVQKLKSWSRKSRPLHAEGLGQVLGWLNEIKSQQAYFQDEAGVLLLSSCWRHYTMLSHLEDRELSRRCGELIDQYLSGIQFYTEDRIKKPTENGDSNSKTRMFFLNCLALLLGRLDRKKLESVMSEYGLQMSTILLSQLHAADEDVIDGAICIFKSAILRSSISNMKEMGTLLPSLLHLLDERDGAARAAVVLVAEYCSITTDYWCLEEVLKRFASGNVPQRRNAADVISELIRISSDSTKPDSGLFWQDIANHLLEGLGDDESSIRTEATNLLPSIDPSLVLPTLVRFICSVNKSESKRSAASGALLGVLRNHNQNFEVIRMLLDCVSNLCQSQSHPQGSEGSQKLAPERVLRLIPKWSESAQDWNLLIAPLVDKMFSEPSNATIISFLSNISEQLADSADIVLGRVLSRAKEQEIDETVLTRREVETRRNDDSVSRQHVLFDHLCPLLIIKILPLRVFDDLNSVTMYGQFLSQGITNGNYHFDVSNYECVAALLLNRAFCQFEFEDVRKLAAELCGRLHPQVLFPVTLSQLEHAAEIKDILKLKACLFSICTSLAIRGGDSVLHPAVIKIREMLESVLLWPSVDGVEVSKAQHGCIDCLALMICAELQASKSSRGSTIDKSTENGVPSSRRPLLAFVLDHLVGNGSETDLTSRAVDTSSSKIKVPLTFRLCMANVLISACQKIPESCKKRFAKKAIPLLVRSMKGTMKAEIKAACIQVFFSAVYHLRSAIQPYADDLLEVSIESLRIGSKEERMGGAKLMAALMASDDTVVESISGRLMEGRSVLMNVLSESDFPPELSQICNKLLFCLTPQ